MRAIVATRTGGPDVMQLQEVPEPPADDGRVLIRVRSAGVNFADALATRGQYAASPPPPFTPGMEVAGEEVGSGRPVMAILAAGGYAEVAAADPQLVFPAEGLDLTEAGGYMLVSLTAYYALSEAVRLRPGESVLVTAGAGGLGSTAILMARALGAGRVTAVASTPAKREFALAHGADAAIGYEEDFPASEVVFDSVGGEVFPKAFAAVPHLGRMALIGASSGTPPEVPGFDGLRRRNVGIFCFSFGMLRRADPARIAAAARAAVEMIQAGRVRPPVGEKLPLAEAPEAHRRLTSRQTTGKLLLIP